MYARLVRLLVIVPAHNEEKSVAEVVGSVPSALHGITSVRTVVVDDGSTDATAQAARSAGATVISHPRRRGLAAAFRSGLLHALTEDHDLIATLDADGQYRPAELSVLLRALREQGADLAVGDRQIWKCGHMPLGNRIGNSAGSAMLRLLGTTGVRDASSGFRVFTRDFASKLRITSEHTYTHEMLIQAAAGGFTVTEAPVTFLPRQHGRSKLVRTLRHHILRSCGTILKSLFLYRPLRKFLFLAAACFAASLILLVHGFGVSSVSDLVVAAILLLSGIQFILLGVFAESQAAARRVLLERAHLQRHS